MSILKKYYKSIRASIEIQTNKAKGKELIVLNVLLILFQFAYLTLRYKYINDFIPFWFTKNWGDSMLETKKVIFVLPALSLLLFMLGQLLEFILRARFIRYLKEILLSFVTLSNLILTFSLVTLVFSASTPFPPLVSPLFLSLFVPFVVGFLISLFGIPYFIDFAVNNDLVTNPSLHQHPAMVLSRSSARGGGSFYAFLLLGIAPFFIGMPKELIGFFVSLLMLAVLGFVDDFQNTHPKSSFRVLENPLLRLILIFAGVAVLVLSGVLIRTINLPLVGHLNLTSFTFNIFGLQINFLAQVITLLWVAWIINLLSWSNGIDGQYTGIVAIASFFICVLALRFSPVSQNFMRVAILAALSSGIALGFTKYTWYPSKIMWGFGATAAGIVISSLSILINTKILVSVLLLLVPFLDAVVTFVRRIMQKRNPLKGDKGHFHHLLLDLGWSVEKIARFYWVTTFVFGLIGVFTSDKLLVQSVLTIGGIFAFIIVLTNLKSLRKKQA